MPVAEAVDGELALTDRLQQTAIVGSEGTQGPYALVVVKRGAVKLADEFVQGSAIVGLGQRVQVTIIDLLRNLGPATQIGNALAHPLPSQRLLGMAFATTVDLEIFRIIQGHFRPQNAAACGVSLVVELDG